MSLRDETLSNRLTAFLDRRSPPQRIASNAAALAAEARAVLAAVLRFAPGNGYEAWWEAVERRIAETSRTRAWPTEAEVADAAKAVRGLGQASGEDPRLTRAREEAAALDALEAHYRATGKQATGLGRPHRTQALVNRGIFADLREARFRGFELDFDQAREAREMRPSRAEWDHHVKVMGRIKNLMPSEAEAFCIDVSSGAQLPQHLAHLDKGQGPAGFGEETKQGFRRMGDAIRGPRDDRAWEREEASAISPEEAASRPYTAEERARMSTLRPRPETPDAEALA